MGSVFDLTVVLGRVVCVHMNDRIQGFLAENRTVVKWSIVIKT